MEFFETNWEWLSAQPWTALGLAVIFFSAGWGLAFLYYDRIIKIHEANSGIPTAASSPVSIAYPQAGRYGKNILANSVKDVQVGEKLSLRAEIPSESRLHIELRGPRREGRVSMAAWFVTLPFINWAKRNYDDADGARQIFDAEGGLAELEIRFEWTGEVEIFATEGTSPMPNWTKTLRVHAAPTIG